MTIFVAGLILKLIGTGGGGPYRGMQGKIEQILRNRQDKAAKSIPHSQKSENAQTIKSEPSTRNDPIFLVDLQEVGVHVGALQFGKRNHAGIPLKVNSVPTPHGLFMHAPNAWVRYHIGPCTVNRFEASVGLMDYKGGRPQNIVAASPMIFRVLGDKKILWTSKQIQRKGEVDNCSIDVTGVKMLELQVDCTGKRAACYGVWVEPRLLRKKLPKYFVNKLGMKFVWIPPGTFMRGSPKGKGLKTEIQHKVTLTKGFYMSVYPVTQEQWNKVPHVALRQFDKLKFQLKKSVSESKKTGKKGTPFFREYAFVPGSLDPQHFKGEKLPIHPVSWEDCQKFIEALQKIDQRPYRLPSEAEWEYACRAGTTTAFSFGETIKKDQANFAGTYKQPTQVGKFPPNAFGLYDMHGNVWEWCEDWHGVYPQTDVVDPQGPKTGKYRILRGGSWQLGSEACRSACRAWGEPERADAYSGFRLCFTANGVELKLPSSPKNVAQEKKPKTSDTIPSAEKAIEKGKPTVSFSTKDGSWKLVSSSEVEWGLKSKDIPHLLISNHGTIILAHDMKTRHIVLFEAKTGKQIFTKYLRISFQGF